MIRKITILIILLLFVLSCNKGSSGTKSDTGFTITPESLLKINAPSDISEGYTLMFNSAGQSGNYAVIMTFDIDEISYVGIAVSNDPELKSTSTSIFNLKIHFKSESIPTSITIDSTTVSDSSITVKLNQEGTVYTWHSGTLTLNLTENVFDDYTTYTITSSGAAIVTPDGGTTQVDLSSLSITARNVSTD